MSVLRIVIATSVVFILAGCGGNDFGYVDNRDVKHGPGLFSGDDGVFTLIKKETVDVETEEEDTDSQELLPEKNE